MERLLSREEFLELTSPVHNYNARTQLVAYDERLRMMVADQCHISSKYQYLWEQQEEQMSTLSAEVKVLREEHGKMKVALWLAIEALKSMRSRC